MIQFIIKKQYIFEIIYFLINNKNEFNIFIVII